MSVLLFCVKHALGIGVQAMKSTVQTTVCVCVCVYRTKIYIYTPRGPKAKLLNSTLVEHMAGHVSGLDNSR